MSDKAKHIHQFGFNGLCVRCGSDGSEPCMEMPSEPTPETQPMTAREWFNTQVPLRFGDPVGTQALYERMEAYAAHVTAALRQQIEQLKAPRNKCLCYWCGEEFDFRSDGNEEERIADLGAHADHCDKQPLTRAVRDLLDERTKNAKLAADLQRVESERDTLREALREYGQHRTDCLKRMHFAMACTCGLAAALQTGKERG